MCCEVPVFVLWCAYALSQILPPSPCPIHVHPPLVPSEEPGRGGYGIETAPAREGTDFRRRRQRQGVHGKRMDTLALTIVSSFCVHGKRQTAKSLFLQGFCGLRVCTANRQNVYTANSAATLRLAFTPDGCARQNTCRRGRPSSFARDSPSGGSCVPFSYILV